MKPRPVLALSLLIAAGVHAVILLVPHPAGREDAVIPTVEISIVAEPAPGGDGGVAGRLIPVVVRTIAPVPAAPAAEAPASQAVVDSVAPTPSDSSEVVVPATERAPGEAAASVVTAVTAGVSGGTAPAGTGSGTGSGDASASVTGTGGGTGSGTAGGTGSGVPAPRTGLAVPRPLADIVPQYPRSARRAGWGGLVRITALIDESGIVTSAEVTSSSGHVALDEAALASVRQTLFEPARQDGKTIACRVIIPVRFRLR
jgi:periplasmic protein TonB